jgi:hypothetical protein
MITGKDAVASCGNAFLLYLQGFGESRSHGYLDDYVGIKRVGGSLDFVPKWPKMELITSDPIQDRMGLWPRKPSPLLGLRPILILATGLFGQNSF